MWDLDAKTIGYIGTALSALIGAGSYWAKMRHERKRSTRTVLYHLLELHHVVHRWATASQLIDRELVNQLKAHYSKRNLPFDDVQARDAMKLAAPIFQRMGEVEMERTAQSVVDAFTSALDELAKENPVLAFQLRGRERLLLMPSMLEQQTKQHNLDDSNRTAARSMRTVFLQAALNELRESIATTASECGVVTRWKVFKLLRRANDGGGEDEFKDTVAWVIRELFQAIESAGSPPIPAAPQPPQHPEPKPLTA